jgi:hypothetical protein
LRGCGVALLVVCLQREGLFVRQSLISGEASPSLIT